MPGDHISIFANGQETLLCDWGDTCLAGASVSPDAEMQMVKYFRGDSIVIYDRSNSSVTLDFTVLREFRDEASCFDAWLTIRNSTPRQGNLTWRSRSGGHIISRYLVNCGLRLRPAERFGIALRVAYQAIGGQITTTPPTS